MEAQKNIYKYNYAYSIFFSVASDKHHISSLFVAIQDCQFPQYTYSSKIRPIYYIASHMHAQNIMLKQ